MKACLGILNLNQTDLVQGKTGGVGCKDSQVLSDEKTPGGEYLDYSSRERILNNLLTISLLVLSLCVGKLRRFVSSCE